MSRKLSEMLYMNNIKSVYHGEHGLRQADQPYQQAKQQDTEHQRQRQPDLSRALRLPLGDARHDDRQKNNIVDPEHDFERREGQQSRPRFRACQQLDHVLNDLTRRITASLATT